MDFLVKRYPKLFSFAIGTILYSIVRKALMIGFNFPPDASFFDPRFFVAVVDGTTVQISYIMTGAGVLFGALGYSAQERVLQIGLYIASVLCLFTAYKMYMETSSGPLGQLIILLGLLGFIVYLVIGSSKKK